ncbi:PAS domain S-box protein [Acidovorax sp. DW039]|uniref:sensor domain-containing diguanylate cyclase n=1 Tax=Acidovorax sp. DW039 TaxID=3095606 RepID=UPI00308DFD8D|nr:PAS domain S-box protein [Acidovorax sp. DW039]
MSNQTPDELQRLAALRDLLVLDTPPEPLFDSITRMAAQVCGVPIALISLVDENRQWFKANVGLTGVSETAREIAFCAHTIQQPDILEVADARRDARFDSNPLVTGELQMRFYAGAPLLAPGGERVGALCVIDQQARRLDAHQRATLQSLSTMAAQALAMRRDLLTRAFAVRQDYEKALADSEARYRTMVEGQGEMVSLSWPSGELFYANPAYARFVGLEGQDMVGLNLYDYVAPEDREALRARLTDVFATGQRCANENRLRCSQGRQPDRWVAWVNTLLHDAQGRPYVHSVGRDITEQKEAARALHASEQLLARIGRVAGVGGWERDLVTGRSAWTVQMHRIHDVEPGVVPALQDALDFYEPHARPVIRQAFARAIETGEPWDLELPAVTAKGRRIWLRSAGEAERQGGVTVRLVGAVQDITERVHAERARRMLSDIIESTSDFVVQASAEGDITYLNPAVRRLLGLAPEVPAAQVSLSALFSPEVQKLHTDVVVPEVVRSGVWTGEIHVLDAQGRQVPVSHMVIGHRDRQGRLEHLSAVMRDISQAEQARLELLRQTGTLRSITEAVPALVAVVGADQRFRFINSAFERWHGHPRDEMLGHTLAQVLGDHAYQRSLPMVQRVLAGETVTFEEDDPLRSPPGCLSVHYLPLRTPSGEVDGFVAMAQDITEHRQEAGRLLALSQRDPLTGLLNRAGLDAYMQRSMAQGGGSHMALLYIDLDHFKPVNDTYGHPVGDELLKLFAQRLRSLVRPRDAVARLGGDEFAVVLEQVRELDHARSVAAKIVEAAQAPFDLQGDPVRVGASVGLAFGVGEAENAHDLIARADAKLYLAKRQGRGQYQGPG